MSVRRSPWPPLLAVPLLTLAACADRLEVTGPEAARLSAVTAASQRVVTTVADDGTPGTLRFEVGNAQNNDVVVFAPALAGATINLTQGEIRIEKSISIVGPSGGVIINGNDQSRVFLVSNVFQVVLENLTLTRGNADGATFVSGVGGSVLSAGDLTIRNSTISSSFASVAGGGIAIAAGGSLTLVGSTISDNGRNPSGVGDPVASGGGLYVFSSFESISSATLINSTISGNTAGSSGGGVFAFGGRLRLLHSTVANNGADFGGGMRLVDHADVALVNSIVADNVSRTGTAGPDVSMSAPAVLRSQHSLIGTSGGYTVSDGEGNLLGVTPGFRLDAFGKPELADNGGPTRTHALLASSAAVGAAAPEPCASAPVSALDQRGVSRPQGDGCDMGAFELGSAPPPPPPATVEQLLVNATASVNRSTGAATVSGVMACESAGPVQLRVELRQQQKQRNIEIVVVGSALVTIPCDGQTAWAAGITAQNGVFINGEAVAAAATQNVTPEAQRAQVVRLQWSR